MSFDFYTVAEVAALLEVTEQNIRYWLKKLGFNRNTRDWLIDKDMLKLLKERKTAPGPESGSRYTFD
jgi:hypothetical protein